MEQARIPFSMWVMAVRLTPTASAKAAWETPDAFRKTERRSAKIFLENIKLPLDMLHKVTYNKNIGYLK